MKFRLIKVLFIFYYVFAVPAILIEGTLIFTTADERAFCKEITNVSRELQKEAINNKNAYPMYWKCIDSMAEGKDLPRFTLIEKRLEEVLYFLLLPLFIIVILQYVLTGKFSCFSATKQKSDT